MVELALVLGLLGLGFTVGQFSESPWQVPPSSYLIPVLATVLLLSAGLLLDSIWCWAGEPAGYVVGGLLSMVLGISVFILLSGNTIPFPYAYLAYLGVILSASLAFLNFLQARSQSY